MSDNREIAKRIIIDAGNTIIKDRPGVHGSTENSFQMIADLWSAYINHTHYVRTLQRINIRLMPVDIAHMMVQLKQARALYGDASNKDNFVDAAGYSALAGMLQLPDPNHPAEKEVEKLAEDLRKELENKGDE